MPPKPREGLGALGTQMRSERERLGWTIADLGARARVAASTVYKIESGAMTPSVLTMLRIARAMGRRVGFFLGEEEASRPWNVSRAGGRRRLRSAETRFSGERLTGALEEGRLYASWLRVDRGGSSSAAPLEHLGEELIVCLKGRVAFQVGEETAVLEPGDAVHYKAAQPHAWRNVHPGSSELLYVLTPPPFAPDGALHGAEGEVAATLLDPSTPRRPSP